MKKGDILVAIALIPDADERLERIAAVIDGKANTAPTPPTARLLTHSETARRLSCSRVTAWRMERDGVLPVVEIRPGVYRVPEAAIAALVESARPRPSRKGAQ